MTRTSRLAVLAAVLAAQPAFAQSGAAKPDTGAAPSAAPAAPTPDPKATLPCVGVVDATQGIQWLQVLPERPPPTLTRLSFDERDGGHVEVVWDPYDARGLARTILLSKGRWQVSLWAEPQRDSLAFAKNYAWQSRSQRCESTLSSTMFTVFVEERRGADLLGHVHIELIAQAANPSLVAGFAVAGRTPSPDEALSALRSFDLTSVTSQASELVVRVVTRAVKKRALRLASSKLEAIVCGARGAPPRLPRTCEAVKGIDLQTISSAARPLAAAVSRDVLEYALREGGLTVPAPVHEAIVTGVELLRKRPDLSAIDVQQVFLAAASEYLEAQVGDAGALAAQVALRVIAYCRDSGPCDGTVVRRFALDPGAYFDLTGVSDDVLAAYQARVKTHLAHLAQLAHLVAEGHRVFDTARAVTNPDRLRAAIRANLRMVALSACFADAAQCAKGQALIALAEHVAQAELRELLRDLAALGVAVLDERQQRRLSLVLALVEQAATVVAGTAEERKLAVAQADAALDIVLDDAASRHGRDGDWIVSIGTGLRLHAAYKFSGAEFSGPVSAPVTLSLDRLCAEGDDPYCYFGGWHFELGFLDVGNYLRIQDVDDDGVDAESLDWTDVASLSAGVGFVWGNPDLPFYFGLTGGVAPGAKGAPGERGWNAHLGGYVGAYIPLLDFN